MPFVLTNPLLLGKASKLYLRSLTRSFVACFSLFRSYIARYAPLKKWKNILKKFYKNFKYRASELNIKLAWIFINERSRYSQGSGHKIKQLLILVPLYKGLLLLLNKLYLAARPRAQWASGRRRPMKYSGTRCTRSWVQGLFPTTIPFRTSNATFLHA